MNMQMTTIPVPTHAWYGDYPMELQFPASWEVKECRMAGHDTPPLDDDQLRAQLDSPYGSPSLRELARGRQRAVILFDDLTRPAPTSRILPLVLADLNAAGLTDDQICFVGAFANHAAMLRDDFVKKLGADVVQRYRVFNHNPFHECVEVGTTSRGTPVRINREVMASDLRIAIGGLIPHLMAGFGGGAKMMVPGVAAIETVAHNHGTVYRADRAAGRAGLGLIDENDTRRDLEEAAGMVGLDFKIDLLINPRREVVQVFAGHYLEQHRAGVEVARTLYATPTPTECDVVVVNTYPIENQAAKGMWPTERSLKAGGIAVIISQCVEGQAPHYLVGRFGTDYGGPLWRPLTQPPIPQASQVLMCSSYPARTDLDSFGPRDLVHPCLTWDEVLSHLRAAYPQAAKAAVYPYASIQLPG